MRYPLNFFYFFLFEEYFMALIMEYNVVQMSVAALLADTYCGGSIFDDFVA